MISMVAAGTEAERPVRRLLQDSRHTVIMTWTRDSGGAAEKGRVLDIFGR